MGKLNYRGVYVYGEKKYAVERAKKISSQSAVKFDGVPYKKFVRVKTINYAKSNSLRKKGIVGAKGYMVEIAYKKLKK